MQPTAANPVILNSLASEVKVITEPMECNVTPLDSPSNIKSNNSTDVPMAENPNNNDSQVGGYGECEMCDATGVFRSYFVRRVTTYVTVTVTVTR